MSERILEGMAPAAASRTMSVLQRVLPQQRNFNVRLWDGSQLPATSPAQFDLVLKPGALKRMLTPPVELSLGEAFVYGDLDIEGDIFAAFYLINDVTTMAPSATKLMSIIPEVLQLPASTSELLPGRGHARLTGALHSKERDRQAIHYHYDVGNDFYALWLDRNLQYSCGYFPTGQEDLDTAQERKLEHICRKLRLQPGERLLDIGCGWGGLVRYAAARYHVQATGVTLSENQAQYGAEQAKQAGLDESAQVILRDYRDLAAESFDKIVSVGMFEHVGRSRLPEYFGVAHRLLKPGGVFLNHGISTRRPLLKGARASQASLWQRFVNRNLLGGGRFIESYVFPDGELVTVSEANLVAEATGFEVRDVENLREHYALTLRHWVRRLQEHRSEAIHATDEPTYRTWRLYMAASAYAFETAQINVNQSLLAKPVRGTNVVPFTRADLYT